MFKPSALAAALVALALPALAGEYTPRKGDAVHVTEPFYSCPERASYDEVMIFASRHPKDTRATSLLAFDRGCGIVTAGTTAEVDDTSVWSSAVCLRKVGSYECRWTSRFVVAKD